MKFGVLSGQTLVKINEMKSSSLLCSRRRMCADGNSGSDATRRTSANLASHARVPSLSLSRSHVRFPLPFFSIAQQGAEPLEPRRRPPLRPSSPPPPDSPRPKPRDFAPKLLRPSTNSAAPKPGRNRARRPPAAIAVAGAPPPPVELPLPALLGSIRAHGEVPRDLLLLPIPFPAQIPRRRCRNAAAPSWSPGCAAGARRGLLLREPGRPRRAPWGRGAPLAAVLPCPAAALAHSQQTRHATPPAAMAWLCCPFATVVLSCEFVSFHVKLAKYIKK